MKKAQEGKVARVATSKLDNERVSITNPVPNPGVIPGRCLQCRLLAIGTENRRGSRVGFGASPKRTSNFR